MADDEKDGPPLLGSIEDILLFEDGALDVPSHIVGIRGLCGLCKVGGHGGFDDPGFDVHHMDVVGE